MAIQYNYDISKVLVQDEGNKKDVVKKIFATISVFDSDYPDIIYKVNSAIDIPSPPEDQPHIPYASLTKGQLINMIETGREGSGLRSMLQANLYLMLQQKDYKEKPLPWQL